MNAISEILLHFGFNEQQAEIYQAILKLGQATVTEIAKKSGRKRTVTYFHIKNLIEKGALKQTREGRVLKFVAVKPDELAQQFDRWTTDFKSIVPQLKALKKIDQETPLIEVTDSKRGYYRIYDEISSLPIDAEFRVIEGKEALVSELSLLSPDQWKMFFERIVRRGIVTKGLFTDATLNTPSTHLNKENQELLTKRIWQLKVLTENVFPMQKLAFIYGDKVAFLFPEESLVTTIQHKGIAHIFIAMFDALFALGKTVENPWK
jgi:sugar-specific transcriptional regulator TrmB